MDMFILGYITGAFTVAISSVTGWLAHRHLIHFPRLREIEEHRKAMEKVERFRNSEGS